MLLVRIWNQSGKWQWRAWYSVADRFRNYGPPFSSEVSAREWLRVNENLRQ